MRIKIDKNPFGERQMFTKGYLEFPDCGGVFCLVGCNGSGKSTVMDYVKRWLEKEKAYEIKGRYLDLRGAFGEKVEYSNYAYFNFDKHAIVADDEMDLLHQRFGVGYSSTGEGIMERLGNGLSRLGDWVRDKKNSGKHLIVFFDDCDAGTSLDMIGDIKKVVSLIVKDCTEHGIVCTFILSANSYEMCKGYECIDVWDFKKVEFLDYEDYKKFVLRSRARKEKSYKNE